MVLARCWTASYPRLPSSAARDRVVSHVETRHGSPIVDLVPDSCERRVAALTRCYGTVMGLLRELDAPVQPPWTGVSVYSHVPEGTLFSVHVVVVMSPLQAAPIV
jgi:hypothetical protein